MADPRHARVVLLGLMGSGKTTVGALLARRLGWRHVDLDEEIERDEGRSVSAIFAAEGEPYFRRREAELTARHVEPPGTVLSPGGGWVTNPSLFALLPADTLTVWLHVSPEEVVRRLRADAQVRQRPLLDAADVEGTLRRLLGERAALYRRARHLVLTDGRDAADVALEIESIVRGRRAASPPS